jgi:hypothetical protein
MVSRALGLRSIHYLPRPVPPPPARPVPEPALPNLPEEHAAPPPQVCSFSHGLVRRTLPSVSNASWKCPAGRFKTVSKRAAAPFPPSQAAEPPPRPVPPRPSAVSLESSSSDLAAPAVEGDAGLYDWAFPHAC